ncbi:multicopper oxidase domain-containing protein [Sulfurimonas sp. SAG-AH-194-C21]|nr:multicopper oxidase domain-containing protein [Sulfurimonas sp. SAG-AH-194-C21]MDF1883173.1 multicopper oxidase domain-containing protein [Sulfurimonas sp. SAG-AH-194-C21]
MNYSTKAKYFALSIVASTLLVGCGGGSSDSTATSLTSISGTAVDPELQGATVFLDANSNGQLDAGEISILTDKLGNYSLNIPSSQVGKPLIVTGGIDRTTKELFLGKLSAISKSGTTSQHITPLTTLVQKYQKLNPTKSIETVKNEIAAKLGLNAEDLDKNIATSGNENLLKIALRVQKVAAKIAAGSSKDDAAIFETIATKLTSALNLDGAIADTIKQEVASGTLQEAKIKDLDKELKSLPDALNTQELALTADNVEQRIDDATTQAELDTDLSTDATVLVDSDNEVQSEKAKRVVKSLGLEQLDQPTRDKITSSDKIDLDNDSIDDIKKKLDSNELGLSTQEQNSVKREQLFNDNGLNNLDTATRDTLKTQFYNDNFDFANSSDQDFKDKLNDDTFLGGDEDFRAKIQGQQNATADTIANGVNLVGSIIKGPIDGATIKLKDAAGALVASTISKNGLFILPQTTLTSTYYTIESVGGSYEDEATSTTVTIPATKGLKTVFTKAELETILTDKSYIAITPETTIYADIVVDDVANGTTLATAMSEAQALITAAMITDSSPLTILPGDKFLQTGDFTSSFPKDQSEAFARNRAISFSYMVRDLNLSADKVFDVMDLVIADYKDGKADGITLADGRDVNVSEEFALSRTKLFQNTTAKLRNGELSDGQKAQLKGMGFDTDAFGDRGASEDANLTALINKYITSTTLPTLHVLPVIADEDGDTTDAKETYTLRATTNVNVTIETPESSWITPMWRYNNNPLPVVIRTSSGTDMTLNLDNQLASDSTIHWHGFKIPAIMDGGPDVPVAPSTTKAYTFTMNQPAAPLWFHPHPDMETGKQVYMGLAGVYLLEDAVSKELETTKQLPSGAKDTVLLVQDRRFADLNTTTNVKELLYKNMAMDNDGMYGDTVLVNGSVLPKQEVSDTLHRYRLYNVSNARTYDFALNDGSDFTVVGTDGGLLESPVVVNHIVLGAAERVEIVIDFSKYAVGDKVMLVSKAFNGDMMGMMGGNNAGTGDMGNTSGQTDMGSGSAISGMGSGSSVTDMGNNSGTSGMTSGVDNQGMMSGMLANGTGLVIMRFDVTTSESEDVTLYTKISSNAAIATRLTEADAVNQGNERQFLMSMGGMGQGMSGDMNAGQQGMQMSFVINGKAFDLNRVDEFVADGATEIWSIRNMSPMAHPFHAHAIQYQILTRNGQPASGTDLGWKDTFLVQPGETVRVIGDFTGAVGDYMYHCHILEHEDAGMMGYFRVGATGNVNNQ